jgi:hypothetical protein
MRNILKTSILTLILGGFALVVSASVISEYAARSQGVVAAEYDLARTLGR